MRPSTFLFFVILAVVLVMLLSACGSAEDTYPEPSPEQNEPGETRSYEWYPMTTPDGLDLWCFDVIVNRGVGVWCIEANPK